MSDIKQRYQRAEKFLHWNIGPKIKNAVLEPHWIDECRFWFKRDLSQGYEFILVDSETQTETRVFNHQRLADVLTELLTQPVSAEELPVVRIDWQAENILCLHINKKISLNRCILLNLDSYTCIFDKDTPFTAKEESSLPSVVSPDSTQEIISRDCNLFLRDRKTGIEKALTKDGERHYGYGNYSDFLSVGIAGNKPMTPAVRWSPDGRYLAVQRIDERSVKDMPVMQAVPEDGSFRPVSYQYKMALPGDTQVSLASLCVIDIKTGEITYCPRPPMPASMCGWVDIEAMAWSPDNTIDFIEWTRDRQTVRFIRFNPENATSHVLLEEQGQGLLGPAPLPLLGQQVFKVLPESNAFIWYSHCSGWGHLYRYNLSTGELINPITQGDYVVTKIHHIDQGKGCLYFTACGREPNRDPYYDHLYRVNLDGSDLVLLTPEASNHDIFPSYITALDANFPPESHGIALNGKVFVDTISRVDQPSRSVLRSTKDGAELMVLSQYDSALLPDMPLPSSFTVKAADDVTDLWGVMYRPGDFDESKQYPVILFLYGTPQFCITQKRFADLWLDTGFCFYQAMAELGFIIVKLEPRGTPLRSKVFHDAAYGNLQSGGGIDDQVAAIKQLGERYPWMDLERVGISGYSGGGFASARAMLSHPDVFKVAVSNAGNHDQRLYNAGWVETFQGLLKGDNYEEQACASLAKNLTGKLLLTHGDRDANVHVAHTLQLIDQLIKHNKDFDLLILPNRQHIYFDDPYFIRRCWDYFVEHLLKAVPPHNYRITPPAND